MNGDSDLKHFFAIDLHGTDAPRDHGFGDVMTTSARDYEPIESPIANLLHPNQSTNPVVKKYKTDMEALRKKKD